MTPIEQRIREEAERIVRDVAELDYTSPEDSPEILQCTADELMAILEPELLAFRQTVLEEAAKIAASYGDCGYSCGQSIAEMIRARLAQEEPHG